MKILSLITGILITILGLVAVCIPFRVFLGIGWVLGLFLAIVGIETIVAALRKGKKDILQCVLGILETILGFWMLFSGVQRILTDVMIAYLIGFYMIIFGVFQIISGCKSCKDGDKKIGILKIIFGVISVIVGFMSVGHPVLTMLSVGYIIAFNILIQGITLIILAFSMKKKDDNMNV